jgi:hypothetical protein
VPAACPHLFTAGKSNSNAYLQYCVTDNGNISSIQTPFGHFHLGAYGEGYGLCQESPATEYHDYISDASNNWAAAQILSSGGSAIKISRTTADGNWTLVQTISKVASYGSIKIVMALTNNQSVDKVAYLVRFADVDPDESLGFDLAGGSLQSAFAWSYWPGRYGLQLQNMGRWSGYQQGFVQYVPNGPNACDFAHYDNGGFQLGDPFSLEYVYADTVPAHKTLTVTMNYRGT